MFTVKTNSGFIVLKLSDWKRVSLQSDGSQKSMHGILPESSISLKTILFEESNFKG